MFRLNVLSKCKIVFDCVEKLPSSPGLIRAYHHNQLGNKCTLPLSQINFNNQIQNQIPPGCQFQQLRFGHAVVAGGVKWLRRRGKILKQRKLVLNPSSPVIDSLYPLPPSNEGKYPPEIFGEVKRDPIKDAKDMTGVVAEINRQIDDKDHGRLFAIINLNGKQFKVTPEDIIIVQGYWAPNVGERLRLHKILLVGSKDFTFSGKPLLDDNLIRIEGTVIEKTLSYTKIHFKLKKRKNYRRINFYKEPYTMVRINMVELLKPLEALNIQTQEENRTVDAEYRIARSS